MSVTLPAAVGDSVMYVFSSASNPLWDFSRIYTLAILQDSATKDLVQAERASVNDTAVANGIWEFDSDCMLQLYPNPVSSWLTVPFSGASTALVSIYSLNGELVFQKKFHLHSRIFFCRSYQVQLMCLLFLMEKKNIR